jgi:hypothetical protein
MKFKLQQRSEKVCKLNYPAIGGEYRRYPWYPRSATIVTLAESEWNE